MSIFNKTKNSDLLELIDKFQSITKLNIDKEFIIKSINESIKYNSHTKDTHLNHNNNAIKYLENKWYESLKTSPDYSVYNDPYYLCDIWVCWVMYSRKSLLSIKSPKSLVNKSVVDYMGDIRGVIDLGCGLGYTTAGLREIFNKSDVYGTNIKDTWQYELCKSISDKYDFKIVTDIFNPKNIDLIFASEYFEHIENPIEHLNDLINRYHPKYFIIANGFNGRAIGHFNYYIHQSNKYGSKQMSLMFNKSMRIMGYKKIETKIWNNRPSLWERK